MSKSRDEAAFVRLGGKGHAAEDPPAPPARSSAAADFRDLADSGEFTGRDLREAIDGLDLSEMSRVDPAAFAALAKEVGARVSGMHGPEAVHEVVRAIMSGRKGGAK